MSVSAQLAAQIGLRGPVKIWVLTAHAWALLVPLALMAVVAANEGFVAARTDFGWALYVAAQAIVILSCVGATMWIAVPVVLLAAIYPWFYVRRRLDILPLAALGMGSIAALWVSFRDPVVLLQLLVSPLTGVLFACLLRTGAQFLHGFVTLVASSNPLLIAWAIAAAVDGVPTPWSVVAAAAVLLIVLIAALPRLTNNLAATPAI